MRGTENERVIGVPTMVANLPKTRQKRLVHTLVRPEEEGALRALPEV